MWRYRRELGPQASGEEEEAEEQRRHPGRRTLTQGIDRSRSAWRALAASQHADPNHIFDQVIGGGGGGEVPHRPMMEEAFGADFSRVKSHTGKAEVGAAGAHALTDGEHIAFRDASPDRATVAHELAHVVQRRNGADQGVSPRSISRLDAPAEREAEAAASAVLAGRTPEIRRGAGAGLLGDWFSDAADWVEDRAGDALDTREDEERLDAEEALQGFMSGTYETENFRPSTGPRGFFDATYDPSGGLLTIISKICFVFKDGSPSTNSEWQQNSSGTAHPASAFQWADEEKEQWAANTLQTVREVWEGQYMFHITRQYWEALPNVRVQIDIQRVETDDAHYTIEVHKWPEDVLGAHVDKLQADEDSETGEWHESLEGGIENPDVSDFTRTTNTRNAYNAAANANPGTVLFDRGSSQIRALDVFRLATFGVTLGRDEMPAFQVSVTGHASSEGEEEDNQILSEDRARKVGNILVSSGAKKQPIVRGEGETGADETPIWRRVDITVGNFEASQRTVAHEYGHIFGLGDEYPRADDGGSRQVGDEVAHSDLAEEFDLTEDPVVAHHSDSIMSNGEVVNPHHYATFMEVLGEMTDTRGEWAIGPGSGPRRGMGDFPTGGGGGTAMG